MRLLGSLRPDTCVVEWKLVDRISEIPIPPSATCGERIAVLGKSALSTANDDKPF
jgi:hypothetical protein